MYVESYLPAKYTARAQRRAGPLPNIHFQAFSGKRSVIIRVFNDKIQLGDVAARQATAAIERAISERRRARIVAATGASQFEFLNALIKTPSVDWAKVEMFHLDEYVGLPIAHP